jgi:hypothetical protein
MDTIVFGSEMPCVLAFFNDHVDEVVRVWESWVKSGEFVRARHEDPNRDAVVGFLPAAIGTVDSVPNDPAWPQVRRSNAVEPSSPSSSLKCGRSAAGESALLDV